MANEEARRPRAAEREPGRAREDGRAVATMRVDGAGAHARTAGAEGLPWAGRRVFLAGPDIGACADADAVCALYHGVADALMDTGAAEVVCPCDIVPRGAGAREAERARLDALLDARTDCLMAIPEAPGAGPGPSGASPAEIERDVALACGMRAFSMERADAGAGAEK